jgi:hypothetical protein
LQVKLFAAGAWAAFDVWADVDDRDYRGPNVRETLETVHEWLRCPCLLHERDAARSIHSGLGGPNEEEGWWWFLAWAAGIGTPEWGTWEEASRGLAQGGSLIAGPKNYTAALLSAALDELRL